VARNLGELPVGLVLGSVEIADCRPDADSGGYAYILRNPVRLAEPLKPRNQPQPVFWRPVFTDVELADRARQTVAQRAGGDRQNTTGPRRINRAAKRLYQPDTALAAVVGGDPLPRKELVSRMWAYITAHNLQDAEDKEVVHANSELQRLFGKNRVSLYEMACILGEHVVEAPRADPT
jgi:upstream activation factor subunit UAF30